MGITPENISSFRSTLSISPQTRTQSTGVNLMVRLAQGKTRLRIIKPAVEQILEAGQMSRQDHLQLTSAILSDPQMTDEERRQINRVFDYVQIGRLKLVD
jgi:hypothetical protein